MTFAAVWFSHEDADSPTPFLLEIADGVDVGPALLAYAVKCGHKNPRHVTEHDNSAEYVVVVTIGGEERYLIVNGEVANA